MKHGIALAGLALVAFLAAAPFGASASGGPLSGRWTVETDDGSDMVQLTIRRDAEDVSRLTAVALVDVSSLRGLDLTLAGDGRLPVRFRLTRDAGTIDCEGHFEGGRGEGSFTFAPNRKLAGELRKAGFRKEPADAELFALAAHDVGEGFLRGLGELGYARVPFEKLVEMAAQEVTPEYVAAFADAGYKGVDADTLVALRTSDVTADFAMEMNARGGRRLSLEELITLRVNGVSPEFTDELSEVGYEGVAPDEMLAMRQHGVTADFIRAVQAEGYEEVATEQLVEMRVHGVSPDYIRKAKARVGETVTIAEMIRMRKAGDDE